MIKRKLLSVLLAICMVMSLAPTIAFATGTASISVTFRGGSADFGWIEIKNGTNWEVYTGTESKNAEAVRIRPKTDYSVDWTGITLKVNGANILTDEIKNQLTGENGYTLTAGTAYALENVEFRQDNSGGNQGGNQGGNPETHTVDFGTGSWTVGEQTVTADKSGIIYDLAADDEITLTDFNADTMQVKLVAGDGFSTTLKVINGETSLSARDQGGLPDGTLTFSVVAKGGDEPGSDPGPGPGGNPSNPGEFSFTCQSQMITGGSIFYKINGAVEFSKVSEENNKYNFITLTGATSITIKFVANEGYKLDTTRGVKLKVNGVDRFDSTTDGNIAEFTSESGHTFNLSGLVGESGSISASSFELEFGFESKGGGPGPEPGSDPTPPHGGYEGQQTTASVTVNGKADFYLNDSSMVNSTGGTHNVTYTYDNSNNTVDFYFCCFINQRITELKINGVDYYNKLPDPSTDEGKEALLAACKGQLYEFKIEVPYSESGYTIESNVKFLDNTDEDYMVVGNFLWTYTDKNQGDDYIDHGRMELVKVNYNNQDYFPEDLNNPGAARDWSQDKNGGSAVLPVGAVVTVKLVPDYGYQLTSFGINGGDFGTGDQQSTFTFEIKPGNAHLGAHFTSVDDKVTSSSNIVSEGNIQLGENEINTGSVVLSVVNAPENVDKDAFKAAVEGTKEYEIASVLDINLNQVIYKGTENPDNVWSNEMTELNNDATITLKLSGDYTDPVVVHEKHDGSYEVIPTTYDSETNTITFKTNSFSNYAIAATGYTPSDPSDNDDIYHIIEGENGTYTRNSDGTLTFRADGDFSKFDGIKVDGRLIDPKNYTAVSGSTIVTLKADYLRTLSAGTHIITFLYNDGGKCSTNFYIKKAASWQTIVIGSGKPAEPAEPSETNPNTGAPVILQTGDNGNLLLWVAPLFVSGAGLSGTMVYSRKKKFSAK